MSKEQKLNKAAEKIKNDYIAKNTKGWDKESLEKYLYEVEQDAQKFLEGATSPAAEEYWKRR